ncbi:MAG: rhodanese-like domain-containing protein [Ignavibacteria bacterium]|nr:rhodanese-like domain-containing protein [Ignavibacteria bacterium]
MKRSLTVGGILVLAIIGWTLAQNSGQAENTITPGQTDSLMEAQDTSVVLLDVRTSGEFYSETGHLRGAILIPVQQLEQRMGELESYRGKTIIAYCRSGNRSGRATDMLLGKGFKAVNMTGGMLRWAAEGRPVEKTGEQ